jgi:hypothetical protein
MEESSKSLLNKSGKANRQVESFGKFVIHQTTSSKPVQIRALTGTAFINAINCGNELIHAVYAISIPSFAAFRRYDKTLPFLQMH